MAGVGQLPVDLDGPDQAASRHVVSQAGRFLAEFGQRAVEMVHGQRVLRDDDRGGVRSVVEQDPGAAAGVRDLERLDAGERNQIGPIGNADARHQHAERAARRRTEHELLGRGMLRDQEQPRALGLQHADLHAAARAGQFLGQLPAAIHGSRSRSSILSSRSESVRSAAGPESIASGCSRRKDQPASTGRQCVIRGQAQAAGDRRLPPRPAPGRRARVARRVARAARSAPRPALAFRPAPASADVSSQRRRSASSCVVPSTGRSTRSRFARRLYSPSPASTPHKSGRSCCRIDSSGFRGPVLRSPPDRGPSAACRGSRRSPGRRSRVGAASFAYGGGAMSHSPSRRASFKSVADGDALSLTALKPSDLSHSSGSP